MDFKNEIAKLISSHTDLSEDEILKSIEIPPQIEMGDFAFPCFSRAKTKKMAPPKIALELKDAIGEHDFLKSVEAKGSYLNFYIKPELRAQTIIGSVLEKACDYGRSDEGKSRVITIDYSSINIAKPFHIGHLSSTAIGHALYNIYDFLGYKPFSINYLGDWGTQFGKLIVAYNLWGDRDAIEKNGVRELLKIYVKFHEEAKKNPALDDEARKEFKKIEDGNDEAIELFDWFKKITLSEVGKIYEILDIEFDSYNGESFYNDKMDRVVDELRKKHLLKIDQGASVVEFPEEENMPPCLILKGDGATLYATRDIASAIYRKETYNFYKSLYVVAYEQNLHFRQMFKVVDMMGYEWSKDMVHVAFGMVSMEDGAMSTRGGKVVFLDEVINRATEKALALIQEKSPDLENKESIAQDVGVGALVYSTLSSSRIKDITFSWDRALKFEGETGPYCQYTHARCCSVLRKAGDVSFENIDYTKYGDEYSTELLKLLDQFPDTIKRAARDCEPFLVTKSVTNIAQAYNKFYFENRILDAEKDERLARLALTKCTKDVIATGLRILGIKAPEKM